LQVGLFHVSAAAERFAFAPLAIATVLLTLVTQWRWGAAGTALARRDLDAIAGSWHALGWWRVAAVLVSLPTALRIVRALVAPPLAWDALTYHLPRAVEWVQRGTIVPLPGPDAATYYTHFPPYGEIYLAWALAATHSDAWLFAVAAWTCVGVLLGAYALARTCGATSPAAAASAAASATIPAVASLVSASYVDNVALATLLVAMTFVLRALANWRTSDAVAAGVTLGLLLGTKSSAFPLAAVLGAWAGLAALVTRERSVARTRALALAAVAAAVVASPPLIRAFLDTGNPLYPLEVSAGPLLHLPGNTLLRETMAAGTVDAREVLQALFGWTTWSRDYDHLGLGPAALGLLALAVVGAVRAGRAALASSTLVAVIAVAIVAPAFSPSVRSLWVFWAPASPRLVAGAVCLAAALATRSGATWMLWALALVSAAASVPRGMGLAEWRGIAAIWPVAAVVAGGAFVAWYGARRQQWRRVTAVCGALAVFVPAAVAPVRTSIRMAVYEEAARGETFDLHRLALTEASAWPLWRELDQRPALRLAIAAGFTGPGHNWYRYPLYGAHFQHAVRYVPVTADGALRSYRDPALADEACAQCWLERLRTSGIDAVVVLPPPTFEAAWARARPDQFSELGLGSAVVFLVQPPSK
ncbi:MAG: glycosyltransferase family 39 protein, partial [Acidobacteria bacterium]|nr:glycosyltransferase family 39 protein [Acidobacteriota bacterium]